MQNTKRLWKQTEHRFPCVTDRITVQPQDTEQRGPKFVESLALEMFLFPEDQLSSIVSRVSSLKPGRTLKISNATSKNSGTSNNTPTKIATPSHNSDESPSLTGPTPSLRVHPDKAFFDKKVAEYDESSRADAQRILLLEKKCSSYDKQVFFSVN